MADRLISRRALLAGAGGFVAGYALTEVFKDRPLQYTPSAETTPAVAPVPFIYSERKDILRDEFIQQFNLILDKSIDLGGKAEMDTFEDGNALERFVWYKDERDNAIALSRYLLASNFGPAGIEKYDTPKREFRVRIDQHKPRDLFENVSDVQTTFSASFLEGSPASFNNIKFDFADNSSGPIYTDSPSFEPTGGDLWKLAKKITESFNWSVSNGKTLRLA